ncbi:ubiquitin carboxyl-terminal hydrolase 45 [Patella vulgata]|uniref:ubiquitin carboxyl-terminal hydrolase 45 n=1 Tax=Patella vulgata TaxID=6465 RepID=UPI0024A89E01|nr:ubiquitin carboxyl-terminal hydrolase 45 [Patella vulgata]
MTVKDRARPLTPKSSTPVVCHKVKGLSNLGNTCFFNAVMQNLSQSYSLESLLLEKTEKGRPLRLPGHTIVDIESGGSSDEEPDDDAATKDLSSIEVIPGEVGPLTQSLVGFLVEMNKGVSKGSSSNTVNPSALFGQICKKAPRFKGFQQQDSHELLRYLLDVIRTEEIKRCQTGILKHFNVNPKSIDEETKMKVKEYGRQGKHTFIDSLFGGQLVSTVMCEECKHVSQIFEPFLDLSLPVTEEKPLRPNMVVSGKKKSVDEVDESHIVKSSEGLASKDNHSKHPSKKDKRLSKKEQRRKEKYARRANKQEDPIFSDGVKEDEEGDEVKEERITEERRVSVDGEKDDKEDHDPSDADVEDNLESDASKLFGGASVNNSILEAPSIANDLSIPPVANTNNLITLNNTNPELQNTPKIEGAQFININGDCKDNEDGSTVDADSSSMTLVENDSSTLFTSTEGSLTASSIGSSHKKSTDSSRSSTCDIKYDQDMLDGNCMRKGLSESLNELHLEDSRTRLGTNGTDLVENLTKKLNYLNLDVSGSTAGGLIDNADIPYIDSVESQESAELSSLPSLPVVNQSRDLPPSLDCNGIPDPNSPNHRKLRQALRKEAQYKSMSTLSPRYQSSGKECSILSCLHQFTSAELLTGSNKVSCERCTKIKNNKTAINKDKKKSETVCSNASKQYLIFQPPAVLTLHLKRFEQVGFASRKVNRHVDFPLVLDLAPYCSSLCQGIQPGQRKVLYSLYGVVEHSGRLSGGHYTAFVKVRPNLNAVVSYIQPHYSFPKEYIHRYVERSINGPKSPETDISEKAIESLIPPGKWYHISDSHVHEVPESSVLHAQAYLLFYERIL